MQVYLPIAEMSLNVFLLLGMGGAVGFLSGLFGVGGGFLMTPLLIFIGVPPAVAVGTAAALDATALITAREGIFPCPESATTVAGLKVALERGEVAADERIVLLITGSGLKSIPVLPAAEALRLRPEDGIG